MTSQYSVNSLGIEKHERQDTANTYKGFNSVIMAKATDKAK